MFGIGSNPILVKIDAWSRYVNAIPVKTKSTENIADSSMGFIDELGYLQTVEVARDNEPVVNAGMQQAMTLRNQVGLKMIDQRSKKLDKGRTSMAERAIQTLSAQSKTLIFMF